MNPKKYILGLTLCALLSPVFAWAIPESTETDLSVALKKAQDTKTSMLVEFTGSDWCPPCKRLRSTVLETPAFDEFLKEKGLMFVELDFPRKPGAIPEEVMKNREEIMFRYGVRGFPSVLLVDAEGLPYAQIVGPGKSPADYFDKLNQALATEKEFKLGVENALAINARAKRADALAAALGKLPPKFQVFQKKVIREIIAADPEDRLGFAKKTREGEMLVEQQKMLAVFFEKMRGKNSKEDRDAARDEALALLENKELLPPVRLALYKFISDGYAMGQELEKALEYLKLAHDADPESREGKALEKWIAQIENIIASIKDSEAKAKK